MVTYRNGGCYMEENKGEEKGSVRKHFKNKYARIGIMLFAVIACSILFYFTFFDSHTLFGFIKSIFYNLTPFAVGAVLAYLLKPLCVLFERLTGKWFSKMKNRIRAERLVSNLSIGFTIVTFLLLIYVLVASVLPQVIDSLKIFVNTMPDYFGNLMDWLRGLMKDNMDYQNMLDDFSNNTMDTLNKLMTKVLDLDTKDIFSTVTVGVRGVFSFLKNLLIGIIACVYILSQRKRLAKQGKMIIYSLFNDKWAGKIMEEINVVDKMFSGFINGKIIDSLIIGVITFIVTSIFRIPYAILISVIVGVTNVIPFFGPYIGAIPCAFITIMVNPIKGLYFIIIIIIIQQFDGNILGPKILGNTTGLSSFWVLFSIVFFGGMFGFMGMLIGVPLFAVLYDLIRKMVLFGLKKRNHEEMYESYEGEKRIEANAIAQYKEKRRLKVKAARFRHKTKK